ncbi:hypothetical protein HZQ52_14300 [Elizabethkingia anophelis]|nr:hypothetical protein [Elizabethkingia anophelis]MCT4216983.1 hypothetical protein [Elizabethkingia anophelis]
MKYQELNKLIRNNFPPFVNKYKTGNIKIITEQYLTEFYNLINQLDESCFKNSKELIINKLQFQNDSIINSINHFLSGELIEYYTLIYDTYFSSKTQLKSIYYKTIPKHSPLFRLRENLPNKNFKGHQMFHIPFEETKRTGNQRFSLSGYPSLYLGNSTYICWEELSRPSLDKCNFSVLRSERNMHMFDITPPLEVKEEDDILRFPLGISCSIKYTDNLFPFKGEYIISQAVFYSLLRFNRLDTNEKDIPHKLDGIMYLSPLVSQETLFSDFNNMYNYVFPVEKIEEKGFCNQLKSMFNISDSATMNDIWLRYPQLFASFPEDYSMSNINKYEMSVFSILEKYLMGTSVKKNYL